MASIGDLFVTIKADTASLVRSIGTQTQAAGATAGAGFGKKFVGGLATAGLAVGVGKVLTSSVQAAGQFEQTLNIVQEAAGATSNEMGRLSDLALKMGADTVFSANEAAEAMLELTKSGITPAQIEAGALEQALNLAATEGLGLADSAQIMANAMNTFGIKAKDAQEATDALAGAATASSAGVSDIAQALAQVGPSAVDAGLSIQETTAALAAFADKGIKGSDAGTSLKTFLARLVPQTEAAGGAFKDLGLKLTDQEGNFKSLAAISQELQEGLKGLSDSERTAALNSAFGSDARRAAIVLAKQGADGIREYTKASEDEGVAQRMAAARMKGFNGAMEALSGSVETLKIALGMALLPVLTDVVGVITDVVNWLGENQTVFFTFAGIIGGAVVTAVAAYTVSMIAAAGATIAATAPILAIIAAVGALVAAWLWAFNNIEWFHNAVVAYWTAIKTVVGAVVNWFVSTVVPILQSVWDAIVAGVQTVSAFVSGTLIPAFQEAWANIQVGVAALVVIFRQVAAWVMAYIWTPIKTVSGYIVGALRQWWIVFSTTWKVIFAVVKVAVKLIVGVIKAMWKVVGPIFRVGMKVLTAVVKAGWAVIKAIWNTVGKTIWGYVKTFWAIISTAFRVGVKVITTVFNTIRSIVNTVREVFSNVVEAVRDKISAAVEAVRAFRDRVAEFFGNLWDAFYRWGRDIIQGLIDGMGSLLEEAGQMSEAVLRRVTHPWEWFDFGSPSKKTTEWGRSIAQGLVIGMDKEASKVGAASERMLAGIRVPDTVSVAGQFNLSPADVRGADDRDLATEVRVFIGDRELTDIVRVETVRQNARTGRAYQHRRA